MRKMKKLAALILAGAMVLGMSTTAMAATKDSATITVNNAAEATLSYVQVIEPDRTTATGWDFVSAAVATEYKSAFNIPDDATTDLDEQKAIAKLIKYQNPSATLPTALADVTTISAADIDKALSNVSTLNIFETMANPETVNSAGVYVIKATETGYTYKAMAAYVGFGEVEVTTEGTTVKYEYPSLVDATPINAKKSPIELNKSVDDADKVVAIDDVVEYTITTYVPYIDVNATTRTFIVTDEIIGADYYDIENATIVMGTGDAAQAVGETIYTINQNGANKFIVDLSSLVTADNANAGKSITIIYEAKITATEIDNTAALHISDEMVDYDTEELFTGQIVLTKYNEDASEKLAGAGFKVTKAGSTGYLTFVQDVDANGAPVAGSYTYDADGTVVEVLTNTEGELVVKGLNVGSYHFEETTAPEGYSINEKGADATLAVDDASTDAVETVATAILEADTDLNDTKLIALPGTGGIGTTVFTFGGVAIIVAAAALFMARRRVAR